jgi:hypothetical protein
LRRRPGHRLPIRESCCCLICSANACPVHLNLPPPFPPRAPVPHRLHWDFDPTAMRQIATHKRPLSAMISLDDFGAGTVRSSLRVWLACTKREHVVTLPPHHLLVWLGDVPHSGCAYAVFNVRCFVYVDQRQHVRVADTTYPCGTEELARLTGCKRPAPESSASSLERQP